MKTLSPSRMVGFMLGPPAMNEMGVRRWSSAAMISDASGMAMAGSGGER